MSGMSNVQSFAREEEREIGGREGGEIGGKSQRRREEDRWQRRRRDRRKKPEKKREKGTILTNCHGFFFPLSDVIFYNGVL